MELDLDKFKKSNLSIEKYIILLLISEGEELEAISFSTDKYALLKELEEELYIVKLQDNYELRGKGRKLCEPEIDSVTNIILYLNSKTGRRFSTKTSANRKFVSGRLSEGYTEEDLKKVIDTMCSRWLDDSKMNIYLRPETLFNPTKFQTYVNLSEIKIIQNSSGKINEMI